MKKPFAIPEFAVMAGISGAIALFCDCADEPQPAPPGPPVYACVWDGSTAVDYLDSLACPDEFSRLSGPPLSQTWGEVQSVKIVYEIATGKLFFVNSKTYEYHYVFCVQVLGCTQDIGMFNNVQYTLDSGRAYCLGSVSWYTAQNRYTLEFFSGDKISAARIALVYDAVQHHAWFSRSLQFFPASTAQSASADSLPSSLPVVDEATVFGQQNYQPLNRTSGYGYLRRIRMTGTDAPMTTRHDIVLLNELPNGIGAVAGIITTVFQSPLSHINVLSRNRGIPNMALRDGWTSPRLASFTDSLIYLEVRLDSFVVRKATSAEAIAFWNLSEATDSIRLPCRDSVPGLFSLDQIDYNSVDLVGAKAANMGELARITIATPGPMPLPEGAFAVPFYYYRNHCDRYGITDMIQDFLVDSLSAVNATVHSATLARIRDTIIAASLDAGLHSALMSRLATAAPYTEFRFRSSTNAEDLTEFNGAGLYESHTGSLTDPVAPVDNAVRHVWASLWNDRAVEERNIFKIDHRTVSMGILVHRSFPDEKANGVAITANIYNNGLPGYTVSAQEGDVSVVNPPMGFLCDQFIFYSFFTDAYVAPAIEYIGRSNITDGADVLSTDEIVWLAKHLAAIKSWFYMKNYGGWQNMSFQSFAMDVEFKFDGVERKLYIKQARPYKMGP